jgi:hypothetical protein
VPTCPDLNASIMRCELIPSPVQKYELAGGPQGLSGEDGRFAGAEARGSQAPQAVSWLLDSDVLSQPAKKAGDARVISWLVQTGYPRPSVGLTIWRSFANPCGLPEHAGI